MNSQRYIFTGPPGAGKTSVLDALKNEFVIIPEPARRVLAAQRASGGRGTGEQDSALFVTLMLQTALSDAENAREGDSIVLFDRGVPDLLAFAKHYGREDADIVRALAKTPYANRVFWFPPWAEIYANDAERRARFDEAVAFGDLIRAAYLENGFELIDVPRGSVDARAAFIREALT